VTNCKSHPRTRDALMVATQEAAFPIVPGRSNCSIQGSSGPSRDKPQWRWITPGSILASVLWLSASLLFSWYAENFGSYNKTYGSLGAAIGFMTWLWISTIVILLGAKLNAELEHQTAKDTTEGQPKPLGQRNAHVADTVGAPASK
jgi:membrane protein